MKPAPRPDLGRLQLESIIVHDVPKHFAGQEGPSPVLSEVESPADQDLRNYFRERLIGTLGSQASDVESDPEVASPVPGVVRRLLQGRANDFVGVSQKVALHLYEVQTGANPAGLVIVVRGKLATQATIGILKLEREEAVRLDQLKVNGKATFRLQHLRDLMLSRNTRVFKAGLFSLEDGDFVGLVSDEQRPRVEKIEVAHFFLRSFLGCRFREDPAVTTKRFFHAAEEFINERVDDPELKTRYQLALLAEMKSSAANVDPRRFSRLHLEPRDQDDFRTALRESADITASFPKDLSRVQTRLPRIAMDFEKKIMLLAPPDVMEQDIRVEKRENDLTHVEFEDRLKGVRGKQ